MDDEDKRIREKIAAQVTFQTENWFRLDYIIDTLGDFGFQPQYDFAALNSRCVGWQYFFMNDKKQIVRVLTSDFLGKYIQVEFQ